MDQQLQQAIVAARSGQTIEAQVLLTQVLENNPEEVQAWFLLSHLVDSEQKQRAYLQKAVAIDPNHEMATARLAQLKQVEAPVMIRPTSEFDMRMPEDPLPDWMTEVVGDTDQETAVTDDTLSEPADIPDWLEETISQSTPVADQPTKKSVKVKTASVAQPTQIDLSARKQQEAMLNRILIGLGVAVVIVLIILIYVIST